MTTTDSSTDTTSLPAPSPTRPSTGYALDVTLIADADAMGHVLAAVVGMAADVRRVDGDGSSRRRLLIACASTDHQVAVQTAIASVAGVEIVAIADAFSSLLSNKPYRDALTPAEAMDVMMSDVGKYDTQILREFIDLFKLG